MGYCGIRLVQRSFWMVHWSIVTAPPLSLDVFPPWSLRGLGEGLPGGSSGKRCGYASADLADESSIPVERVRLTRRTCSGYAVHSRPDPGLPTPKWEVRSARLPTFFLALRLVDLARGTHRKRGLLAGQSSRRDRCAGSGLVLIRCMCMRA